MRALVTAGRAAFRTEDRLPVCASVDPPDYSGSPIVRSFEPFEQQVRQLLEATIPYDQPALVTTHGDWEPSKLSREGSACGTEWTRASSAGRPALDSHTR